MAGGHDRRLDRRHAGARKVRIKEVVPGFDGRRLDDIVDFLNYTFLPLLLIWRGHPARRAGGWLFLPLLASVYGFCQVQAKTDDGYFLGFPSLWNLVALYLYIACRSALGVAGDRDRAGPADLCADPPSLSVAARAFNRVSMIAGVPWTPLVVWLIWKLPSGDDSRLDPIDLATGAGSLLYPVLLPGRLVGRSA